jgi:glycosyltransferase involved in cell wall biosynthesis
MSNVKISLVIPAYNEEKYITPTLKTVTIAKEKYEKAFNKTVEVIVVDNDSTDNTGKIAKEYGCKIVNFKKHNIAAVRNAGAKKATGKFIAFVDADSSILHENTFINIHKNLENQKNFGGGSKIIPDKINSIIGSFGFGLFDYIVYCIWARISGIQAGLFYLRKKDFEELKGFDESYYALEDRDFALRMKKYAKEKNQKIINLNDRLIISSRKNNMISSLKMFKLLLKMQGKDAVKNRENVYESFYDVENLR